MDLVTLNLAKNYSNTLATGIKFIKLDGYSLIFTLRDGSDISVDLPIPKNGESIEDVDFNDKGELICTLSNKETINAGIIPIDKIIKENDLEKNSNKVSYINENSTDEQYPSAKCVYELKDSILEKSEASGSYINISDGNLDKIQKLSMDGICKQENYTGKNLLNYIDNLNVNINGITNTINSDGSITTTGKPTVNYTPIIKSTNITDLLEDKQVYTISQEKLNRKVFIQIIANKKDGTYKYYDSSPGKNNITIDKSLYTSYNIVIQTPTISVWGDSSLTITNKYMLCKGTDIADTSFEPYVGRQSSPSSDYPSEIESVKGVNLWKPITTETKNGMTFTNNGDGSYTLNGTATATTSFYITGLNYIAGTYTLSTNNAITNSNSSFYIQVEYSDGSISRSFTSLNAKTTKTTAKPITACSVVVPNGITLTNFTFKPQLEKGPTATEFVPYNCIKVKIIGKNLYFTDNDSYSFVPDSNGWFYVDGGKGAFDSTIGERTIYKGKIKKVKRIQ